MTATRNRFQWDDPLLLETQITDTERAVRDAAQAYCQDLLAPRVLKAFRDESADAALLREMGEFGLLGAPLTKGQGGQQGGDGNITGTPTLVFVDGHVESRTQAQTLGPTGSLAGWPTAAKGVWTITAGD